MWGASPFSFPFPVWAGLKDSDALLSEESLMNPGVLSLKLLTLILGVEREGLLLCERSRPMRGAEPGRSKGKWKPNTTPSKPLVS